MSIIESPKWVVCPERKGGYRISTQVCRLCELDCLVKKKELKGTITRYPKFQRRSILTKNKIKDDYLIDKGGTNGITKSQDGNQDCEFGSEDE
jgi:hypothetical protein